MEEKKRLKVGIIGCGGIANGKHMPAIKAIDVSDMVAFCDLIPERAEKAAKEYGVPGAKVYTDYRGPFLEQIPGALTKDLLIRDEDVQVLHGFDSVEHAQAYLTSEMFQNDVFVGLKPLWDADPDVKIYTVA